MKSSIEKPWDDLVVALLAVNQYSLEKTFALLDSLRAGKITDPEKLGQWTEAEMFLSLKSSGCDRGPFMTALFAERLCALGGLIRAMGVSECETVLTGHDRAKIEALLLPVNGIGPKVLKNFFVLRGLDAES